jgi:peptidoglycan/LPS O-acetylase OafA/YrhL
MSDSTSHRGDIQALRGVAILAVLSHHAGVPGLTLPAGHRGVDLFFVISGYVIAASLVARDRRGERFRIGAFLMRRVRRLFPAFFATLVGTLIFGFFVQSYVKEYQQSAQTGAAATVLFANYFLLARTVDYFNPLLPNSFVHTWSLSVEEQFYLTFAVALGVASIWRSNLRSRPLRIAAPVALVGSWIASQWPERLPNLERYFTNQDLFPFYSFHSRAWQILTGVVVAQHANLLSRIPSGLRGVLRLAGLALAIGAFMVGGREHHIGNGALVITVAGAAVIAAGSPRGVLRGGVVVRLLGKLGDRSYALYLVHWPVIMLGSSLTGGHVASRPLLVALSLFLAEILHRRVEYSWQEASNDGTRWHAVLFCVGSLTLILMSLGLSRIANSVSERAAAAAVWDRVPPECVSQHDSLTDGRGKFFPADGGLAMWCSHDDPTTTIGFALEGDSHGGSLVREFLVAARASGASAEIFARTARTSSITGGQHIASTLDDRLRWVVASYIRQGEDSGSYEEHLREIGQIDHVVALVVYLDNPFMDGWRSPSLLREPIDQTRARSEQIRTDDRRRMLERLEPHLRVPLVVVDPFDAVCDATTCFGGRDGIVWYIDEDHLSVGGMRQLQNVTTRAFREALTRAGLAD